MNAKRTFTPEQLHYLRLLSKQYPTVQAAGTEVIRLNAILNLPKGTEHFMSDIHGEHEAEPCYGPCGGGEPGKWRFAHRTGCVYEKCDVMHTRYGCMNFRKKEEKNETQ